MTPCPVGNAACNSCGSVLQSGITFLQDANLTGGGTGSTCRHNNQSYVSVGGPASSPVNYPAAPFSQAVTGACGNLPSTVNIPRHYYTVASVQFCTTTNVVNNAQWRGFGTGVCQAQNDLVTHKNVSYGKFTRVDLVNDGRLFNFTDPIPGWRRRAPTRRR